MNLTEMFSPSTFLSKELQDSIDDGLTRIEISYHANDTIAEHCFFDENFANKAKFDIDMVKYDLDEYRKLIFKVNLKEFLEAFEQGAKPR